MYAGSWYEADASKLAAQLNTLLAAADKEMGMPVDTTSLQAVVSPHAGYAYSGSTAAFAFQRAKVLRTNVQRIFLLGPSHRIGFNGIGLPSSASFATPLGPLQVESELILELKDYPLFSLREDVHQIEHSLELQLPFIKATFPDATIIPLIVGALAGESEIRLVAEILKGFVRNTDLIVVSTDFTHYGPRYDFQPFHTDIQNNIKKLDQEAIHYLSNLDLPGWLNFQERTQDTICGFLPCAILCALLPPDSNAELLSYSTSSQVITDAENHSVSYASMAFSGQGWPVDPGRRKTIEESIDLDAGERQTLMKIARKSLSTFVMNERTFDAIGDGLPITSNLQKCFGAFVTLYQRPITARMPVPEKELRGCIGSIWPVQPLWKAVMENAIASASRDPRFVPVNSEELDNLRIEISVLTPPRRVQSPDDIVLGTDGIILSKNNRQSVFLPVVAKQYGWSLVETLQELCLKAGLQEDDWKQGAKFDVFQSLTIHE